jgi:hypothetical protein
MPPVVRVFWEPTESDDGKWKDAEEGAQKIGISRYNVYKIDDPLIADSYKCWFTNTHGSSWHFRFFDQSGTDAGGYYDVLTFRDGDHSFQYASLMPIIDGVI